MQENKNGPDRRESQAACQSDHPVSPDKPKAPMKVSPSSFIPNPGDDAKAGTPGTGEDVCPRCAGTGTLDAGSECPECNGTGIVIQGIGGG